MKKKNDIEKIVACVVLYNPENDVIKNINSYLSYVNELVIVDNSTEKHNIIKNVKSEKIKYIKLNGNEGIAKALKIGMQYAIDKNYEWCLTMDQDSSIDLSDKDWKNIKRIINKNTSYGILSFNFNNYYKINEEVKNVKTCITSGNFVNVSNYKKIEGFNEELFIDCVDFDICRQFNEKNIKIGILNYSISHTIGNPITKKILWRKFNCMNHAPIRYYYRYRNIYYLFNKNKKFYLKLFLRSVIIEKIKLILYEDNKKQKLKMIKKGIIDAKNNKLGKFID